MKKKYTCVYRGRRINGSGVLQNFVRDDGTEMHFKSVRGVVIGATYECGKNQISRRPQRNYEIGLVENASWEAADAMVEKRNRERRAEALFRKKANPMVKAAIAAILPLCKNTGYFERRALIEYLTDEVDRKLKRKGK